MSKISTYYSIHNKTKNNCMFTKVKIARTFFARLGGLMLKKLIDSESALIFYNAGSIHTCFMLFSIDIIFCDKELRVISIHEKVRPWRLALELSSFCTIECCAGSAREKNVTKGDFLALVENEE